MRSIVLLFAISLACPARADLVLNEVLYDPAGADEGLEFVELWNGDDVPRPLAGIAIEAGDGAHPEAWVVIHRGQDSDSVAPHAAYLVSGVALGGAIQNGPDAVRLTRDGVPLDRLGWGDLESSSLFEGAAAPDVPSGHSLARREDGRDGDSNAADWADEGAPTPGRANHPDERLVFDHGSAAVTPIVAWPGEPMAFVASVRNRGRRDVAGTRWRLVADAEPPVISPGVSIASGESALVSVSIPTPQSGAFLFRVRLEVAEGVPASDLADTAVVPVRSVAAPAVIHEIAFRDAGSGEWVELWFREPVPDVGLFALADATASPRSIDRGPTPRPAAAGEFLVIAQDSARVASGHGLGAGAVLGVVGGWPSLNDVPGASGVSDVVRLLGPWGPGGLGGPGGAPSDAVPYRGDAASRGGSLERLSPDLPSAAPGSWGESVDPARGTPGRPNSLRAPEPGTSPRGPLLVASAKILRRGGATPLLFRLTPEARHLALTVDVRDLLGRARRVLLRGQRFVSEGAFAWDGRDDAGQPVAAGIYIVRAEGVSEGTRPRVSVLAIAVSGEAR